MANESQDILSAFREIALASTKLYRNAASAQAKGRSIGYQECLDDLLAFLDKENLGVGDGEGWRIRSWATERLEDGATATGGAGERTANQGTKEDTQGERMESGSGSGSSEEDNSVKAGRSPSPQARQKSRRKGHRQRSPTQDMSSSTELESDKAAVPQSDDSMATEDTQTPTPTPTAAAMPTSSPNIEIIPPTLDSFAFRSNHAWPNIASLDLGDSRNGARQSSVSSGRSSKSRHPRHVHRMPTHHHQRASAGQKRKLEYADFFDIASFKDGFGPGLGKGGGGKKSRHV